MKQKSHQSHHLQKKEGELPVRSDSELLAEILETVRNIERKTSVPIKMVDVSGNIETSGTPSKVVYTLPSPDDWKLQQESHSEDNNKKLTSEDVQRLARWLRNK